MLHALNLIYEKKFTIHYGEIKTMDRCAEVWVFGYLQSTMVRLRLFFSS